MGVHTFSAPRLKAWDCLDKDRWKFDRLLESIDVDGVYDDKAIEDMTIDDMNIDSITGRIKQTIGLTKISQAFKNA